MEQLSIFDIMDVDVDIEYSCNTCAWYKTLPLHKEHSNKCMMRIYNSEDAELNPAGCKRWMPKTSMYKCCGTCKHCNPFEYEGADINHPIDEPNIYCTHKDGSKNRHCRWANKVQKGFGVGLYHRQHEYDVCDNWELDSTYQRFFKDL